jgi:hypothetical protein
LAKHPSIPAGLVAIPGVILKLAVLLRHYGARVPYALVVKAARRRVKGKQSAVALYIHTDAQQSWFPSKSAALLHSAATEAGALPALQEACVCDGSTQFLCTRCPCASSLLLYLMNNAIARLQTASLCTRVPTDVHAYFLQAWRCGL